MLTRSDVRRTNREYRTEEGNQSDLWPVTSMDFDLAERVILVAREYLRHGDVDGAQGYRALLDQIASDIVNDSAYWRIGLRATIRRFFGEVSE